METRTVWMKTVEEKRGKNVLMSFNCFMPAANRFFSSTHQTSLSSTLQRLPLCHSYLLFILIDSISMLGCCHRQQKTFNFKTHVGLSWFIWWGLLEDIQVNTYLLQKGLCVSITMQSMHNASGLHPWCRSYRMYMCLSLQSKHMTKTESIISCCDWSSTVCLYLTGTTTAQSVSLSVCVFWIGASLQSMLSPWCLCASSIKHGTITSRLTWNI